jgi:hypothetical protein
MLMMKEGREDVQDNPISGQPKTQRTDTNVDGIGGTLVHSDQRSEGESSH